MKAFVRTDATTQDVKLQDVAFPAIKADEALVRVEAFGVGIHDRYFIPMDVEFPYTIGSEGSGVITEIGSKVDDFAVGDSVMFTTILQPQGGSWAEYAVAKQAVLISLPDELSFAKGAAVPIAGKTALECIRAVDLDSSDSLFIAGASGAIGTFVIQLAVKRGIRVAASTSEKNYHYLRALGVEKAVDYNDTGWKNQVMAWSDGGVTAALAIQPGTGIDSIKVVKDGGKLITVSGDNDMVTAERSILVQQMGHSIDTQQKMVDLVTAMANGEIKIVIEREYPFEQALEALAKTETRHARGKLTVTSSSSSINHRTGGPPLAVL